MNFLFPLFGLAALCIVIPIIIHLFNFKKFKKVYFSDVRFLQEIKQETNKKRSLKHFLILASRIAAILSLVLAFMQPFLGEKDSMQKGPKCISIFIDNSNSMLAQNKNIPLLALAKNKAINIIKQCGQADQFQILTQDFKASENKILDKQQALQAINNISISGQSKSVNTVLQLQQNTLSTNGALQKAIIYISDFQKNKTPLPISFKANYNTYFLPINNEQPNNICLDSVWFENPSLQTNETQNLKARIINYNEDKGINTALQLVNNGQIKSVKNINLSAAETQIVDIPYTTNQAGQQQIQLQLTDYPISFDDTFYIGANVAANYSVLLINDGINNPYLSTVFKTGNSFRTDNANTNSIKPKQFDNYSLIVLCNLNNINTNLYTEIERFINAGGNVLVFPSNNISLNNYNETIGKLSGLLFSALDTTKLQVNNVNQEHSAIKELFDKIPDNVELPKSNKHYPFKSGTFNQEQKIFSFANGDAFLTQIKLGNGSIYYCASAADVQSSNFTNSYWFLPILFKIGYNSATQPINAYTLGAPKNIFLKAYGEQDNMLYHLTNKTWDAIPQQFNSNGKVAINFANAAQYAGLYNLMVPAINASNLVIGLNYNRQESNLAAWPSSDLKAKLGMTNGSVILDEATINTSLKNNTDNKNFWRWCLLSALLFLFIEVLLIRFLK